MNNYEKYFEQIEKEIELFFENFRRRRILVVISQIFGKKVAEMK